MTHNDSCLASLDCLAGIVILAGGASSRMGAPKATLTLPSGELLLDYHVRHALDLNTPILVADNGRGFRSNLAVSGQQSQSPVVYIADYGSGDTVCASTEIKNGGALVAIESGLQQLQGIEKQDFKKSDTSTNNSLSWVMVISCDSLIPATDLWQKLQPSMLQVKNNCSTKTKVICLTDEQHLYPLLGLYQLSVEPALKAYIDSGQRRAMTFIKPLMQTVPLSPRWQPLTNFNTPTAFERACLRLNDL
ncbi:molybdenum cofactor guanylyltransferase [Psychrobacter sp.]|uniref:molybdenum cofactor guanylyltransferase n=1 Tax=Psychrobacter sp. TaxID=56811 RepID=UPI003F9934FC